MRAKRIKIEVTLDDGSKITLSLPSFSSKAKISRFLELLELLEEKLSLTDESLVNDMLTKSSMMDKVIYLVYSQFIGQSFTLKDLIREFRSVYGIELKNNTAATYLSRLVEQGVLKRSGSRGSYIYTIVPPSRRPIIPLKSNST